MSACFHCDEAIVIPLYRDTDIEQTEPFCCRGCLTVFNILHEKGLDTYYDIKKESGILKRRSPVELKAQQFQYLDSADFQTEYAYLNLNNQLTMEFYLEGIHCLACLWLIEKIPEFINGVAEARLDVQKSIVTVSLMKDSTIAGKFSAVASEFNNLGYRPHVLKKNQSAKDLKLKEERSMFLKIGIAAAGSGNVMIYSISIYAGASGFWQEIFNFLTILLSLPVFLYSAIPFYKAAWFGIKNKQLNIDVPIAFAIVLGIFHGLYNVMKGVHENYFDSLTGLIFLLLLARYFLNKIQEEGLSVNDLNFFYQGGSVLKKEGDKFIEVHPQYLAVSDHVKVGPNEMIPADGIIVDGHTTLNSSLLTGETIPVKADIGTYVFSGTMNIDREIILEIKEINQDSRIGKILKQVESGWIQKSRIVNLINKISQYFIWTTAITALFFVLYFVMKGQTLTGIERAITLLVVTCPCALALATPLTLTRTLSRAARKGIIIKNDEIIEKLARAKAVCLDKTGTVTYGQLKVETFTEIATCSFPVLEVICSLEKNSQHPVARALIDYADKLGAVKIHQVEELTELLGVGVKGHIGQHFFEIKNGALFENGSKVAEFTLSDLVRTDSKAAVDHLKKEGLDISILSGDQKKIVQHIAAQIGLGKDNVLYEMSPESKLEIIAKSPNTIMVGDGANDAMALSQSYVGVAVLGAMDISLRAADVYLTYPGITPIAELVTISKETMRVIYRNLFISLLYNIVSIYAAWNGTISPLHAAIIMPVSSLTVLFSTMIGTGKLNRLLKEN